MTAAPGVGPRTPAVDREAPTARQVQLLTAAVQVVGESGLRGLTHRAVDREAGLPEGTCSVSYRTRIALLSALAEFVGNTLTDQIQAMGDVLPEPEEAGGPEPAIAATIDLLSGWLQFPAGLICMCELGLEMIRTPSLREMFQPWREHMLDVVEGIVERGGKTEPRLRAQAILASVEGVLMSALERTPEERTDYLRDTLSMVMRGLTEIDLEAPTGP
ncbi:TetR/AcrR family transcriptional regulator [Luteipulveratus mongoliensis]|uniref:TetR/AcrR family transcriptional regulator n=1 Tax=Luteipulveratus mongoliensis TaxID=571913 RepID=UPI0006983344|nr:hypothetical protein [Luteipulveratus mongoliensis]